MKWLYRKICIPLMLINDNVYTFISGIVISLATNIFTSLFMDKDSWHFINSWHMYVSVILYLVTGGVCICIATKIGPYHDYMKKNEYTDNKKKRELLEGQNEKSLQWVIIFLLFFLTITLGTVFFALNYII